MENKVGKKNNHELFFILMRIFPKQNMTKGILTAS